MHDPLDSMPSQPKRSNLSEQLLDRLVDEVLHKCPLHLHRKLAIALTLRVHLSQADEQERAWLASLLLTPPF